MGAVVLPNRLRAGMSPAAVSSAISAAIAAYALTDVGVRPLYSWTGTQPYDDLGTFGPAPILPVGATRATGAWKAERGTTIAVGTFSAWWLAASGEILLDGVQSAALGATLTLQGTNVLTGEWTLLGTTTALPEEITTWTLDFWTIEA